MVRNVGSSVPLIFAVSAMVLTLIAGCGESDTRPKSELKIDPAHTIPEGDSATLATSDTGISDTGASATESARPEGVVRADASSSLGEPFYGGFAYSDRAGQRLLTVERLTTPEAVREAICQSGELLTVAYEGYQSRSDASNGRQDWQNFANDDGDLFRVNEGSADAGETCFLIGPSLASLAALAPPAIPRRQTDVPCDPADHTRLTVARARALVSCSEEWSVEQSARLLVATFEPRGDSALAALVWADENEPVFLDFEGVRNRYGDVWRVDGQGVLDVENFHVLMVVDAPSAKVAIMAWDGSEGQSLWFVLAPSGGHQFQRLVGGYRYWMGV